MESGKKSGNGGLVLIILYMFLEYVRPQSLIPALSPLHIPMVVQFLIILALFTLNFNRVKTKETTIFLLLLCLMALHIPIATNNYWAFQITKNMTLEFVVFLGIVGFLDSYKKLNVVLGLWVLVAILCAVRGYLEGGRIPDSGILGDENDFALFLNMMIPVTFFAGYTAGSRAGKLFYYSGVVALILGTISSMSRGGFLGMIPPLVYCWWKTPGRIKTAVVAAFVGAILVTAVIPTRYWTEMRTIRKEGTSTGTGSQRAYLWHYAFLMFLDHPLIGVGPGNYNWNLEFYEPVEGFNGRSQAGRPSHSIYFTMLPELGLVGTFLFFSLIWVNVKESRRVRKESRKILEQYEGAGDERIRIIKRLEALGYGLTGAIIAYLISGAFLSVLYYGHFWLILAFAVATNVLLKEHLQEFENTVAVSVRANEDSIDRWQYASSAGDYPFPR